MNLLLDRSAHSQGKTNRIVAAARSLFLEQGFAVSVDMVAKLAHVSKPTIYSRYPSKADLFEAVILDEAKRIFASTDQAFKTSSSGIEGVLEYSSTLLQHLVSDDHCRLLRIVYQESERFPDVGIAYNRLGPMRGIEHLAEYLHTSGAMESRIRAEAVAQTIIHLITGRLILLQLAGAAQQVRLLEIQSTITAVRQLLIGAGASTLS